MKEQYLRAVLAYVEGLVELALSITSADEAEKLCAGDLSHAAEALRVEMEQCRAELVSQLPRGSSGQEP